MPIGGCRVRVAVCVVGGAFPTLRELRGGHGVWRSRSDRGRLSWLGAMLALSLRLCVPGTPDGASCPSPPPDHLVAGRYGQRRRWLRRFTQPPIVVPTAAMVWYGGDGADGSGGADDGARVRTVVEVPPAVVVALGSATSQVDRSAGLAPHHCSGPRGGRGGRRWWGGGGSIVARGRSPSAGGPAGRTGPPFHLLRPRAGGVTALPNLVPVAAIPRRPRGFPTQIGEGDLAARWARGTSGRRIVCPSHQSDARRHQPFS